MNRLVIGFSGAFLSPGSETWAQKNLPTVRIGIEAPAGTNSHYYVTKQLGLFQKHGINIELISFPGDCGAAGVVCRRYSIRQRRRHRRDCQANLRGANIYFVAGMINTFPFSIFRKPEIRMPQIFAARKS